ncbi:NAD-dependent DNA ligase LigA [Kistimonas scapharcae]|uniref:DNA ligase n=1 Tax=Kistimonas scapharcae TaxID=1036133 RepID=A0ABP8V4D6_9GAMM
MNTNINTQTLVDRLTIANDAYRAGQPIISDSEYDLLSEQLRDIDPANPFLSSVEVEPVFSESRVKHSTPMLSTQKAYAVDDVERWIAKSVSAAEAAGLDTSCLEIRMTPKLDGMAARLSNKRLVSRGNGLWGSDLTPSVQKGVRMLHGDAEGEITGEIVLTKSYFEAHLAGQYKHPRNVVVGAVAAETVEPAIAAALKAGAIHFRPFSTLKSLTFAAHGGAGNLLSNIDDAYAELTNIDYPTDGIVLEFADSSIKDLLGSTSHHHNWQLAKKVRGETALARVQSVSWQVGRTGKVSPVIKIEPTELSGAVISNVTGHHAANILSKGIGKGARVEIVRSGEVIPYVTKVVEKVIPDVPEHCPCCSTRLVWNNDFLYCPEDTDCSARSGSSIKHFFTTVEHIKGFGSSVIDRLVSSDITSVSTILSMTIADFENVGISTGIAQNLYTSIQNAFQTPLEDWRLLGAFGIHCLGRGTSRRILENISLEEFLTMTESYLLGVEGIGLVAASSIIEGREKNLDEIKAVLAHPWCLVTASAQDDTSAPATRTAITGKTIVVTGKLSHGSRTDIHNLIISAGGKPSGSLSKKTDMLVCGESAGSKLAKAQFLGVEVISEDAFLTLVRVEQQQVLDDTESSLSEIDNQDDLFAFVM